jgi:alkyl sulfatase BDS1-like metallo-beta-lactamase superfamily hydrolase
VLIPGIDHILSLGAEHLLGTHGPPLSGRTEIQRRVTLYRDSIQFLWDQTVRGLNRGLTADQLAASVVLPSVFEDDYLTTQFYGVAEHHVRQIAAGIRGWFDGDAGKLFPLEPVERASRLVERFGGADAVRADIAAARAANDLRWALELANWLAGRKGAEAQDRKLLADVLRDIAYRTSAANIRNWCLTRARDLDGSADLSRLREHRLRANVLAAQSPRQTLHMLRVLLDPDHAEGFDHHVKFKFRDAPDAGLHIRNGVAVATDGTGASSTLSLAYEDLIAVLTGKATLRNLLSTGRATLSGDAGNARGALACLDILGFADDLR